MKTSTLLPFVLLAGGIMASGGVRGAEAPRPVSLGAHPGISGGGHSFAPLFSADGRYVVFLSHANNLVTNDDAAPNLDAFRHELATGKTVLISVNHSGTGGGSDDALYPSIASNGQFIAFSSVSSNLVGNDTNSRSDVFLRGLGLGVPRLGVTRLVSVNTNAVAAGNSGAPVLSADGRWVAFESAAPDLVSNDGNQVRDVFVRDLVSNVTALVSVDAAGTGSGNDQSMSPAISADGRCVAFLTRAMSLLGDATNSVMWSGSEVCVRDMVAGHTRWVSLGVGACSPPVLSADGRVVVFGATPKGLGPRLYRHELETTNTTLVSSNGSGTSLPGVSADGRLVVYESETNVFVWDALTGTNELVSVNQSGSGPGNGPSHSPVMTPDGTRVAFLSSATDLVTNPVSGQVQLYVRDRVAGTTRLVSVSLDGVDGADLSGVVPAISDDGRWVAFDSADGHLVAGDSNQARDVFVRNLDAQTTRLVSVADPSLAWVTAAHASSVAANEHVYDGLQREPASMAAHTVSDNGRYVVFSSYDSNLVPGDTNRWPDIFVRDLVSGVVTAVSREPDGFRVDRAFSQAALSADGRYVVFAGRTNAPAEGAGGVIYWRDLQRATNRWLAGGLSSAAGRDYYPFSMSWDGRWIAYQTGSAWGTSDVFLRDASAPTNQCLSLGTSSGYAFSPVISPDGHRVAFASSGSSQSYVSLIAYDRTFGTNEVISLGPSGNLLHYRRGVVFSRDSRQVAFVASTVSTGSDSVSYVRDLVSRSTTQVCVNCDNPSLSRDGRLVAFEAWSSGSALRNILLRDLKTGDIKPLSLNLAGTGDGNGRSTFPQVSDDGHYVVFASQVSDLVPDDNNRAGDIFVRDLRLNATLLVSMNRFGTGSGNGHSTRPVLGADGSTVVFLSYASDLVEGDFNHQRDVFVLHLPDADSDGDGLEDEWEVAHFGDLTHDGSGDTDHDGLTDGQEYLAGTDPTNSASVLRVLRVIPVNGGPRIVVWSAISGRDYRVQYKDRVTDPTWSELPFLVTATTTTAHFVDSIASGAAQRFYRVTLVP